MCKQGCFLSKFCSTVSFYLIYEAQRNVAYQDKNVSTDPSEMIIEIWMAVIKRGKFTGSSHETSEVTWNVIYRQN
jgi:hypothetical protein